MSSNKELIDELNKELFDLTAKVIHLIRYYPGWDKDDSYTFPDGDTWHRFDPERDAKAKDNAPR